jgi:hypothetical protein
MMAEDNRRWVNETYDHLIAAIETVSNAHEAETGHVLPTVLKRVALQRVLVELITGVGWGESDFRTRMLFDDQWKMIALRLGIDQKTDWSAG